MTNILYKLESKYPSLTKSEKKIADYILRRPQQIVDMTTHTLADWTSTSPSSVVRFGYKITDGGFQELETEVSKYMSARTKPRQLELQSNESLDTIKRKMLSRTTQTLCKVSDAVDENDIDKVCARLKQSRTVFIFGFGASYVAARGLFQKLSRVGINVHCIEGVHTLINVIATHDARDCLFIISNSGEHNELEAIARVASDYHLFLISLMGNKENPITNYTDIDLIYGETDESEVRMAATTSLTAQLFMINVLYYHYLSLDFSNSLDLVTQSKMALNNYKKHLSNIEFEH
ncbi:MurR/RpiR family transcriptional regulator [Staphylococcus carnosus]|uniref:RpiR family transcriptional regulator n=1 Tax=Staphylococcus carnosus TaxID=1281 RepID=A0AAJ0JP15_STACA|nr:MurR/RpiR family transcriptional regulator [Staphylococcus carnosus]KKB25337.1 RpiR family transcriptional regulator [Staphylococcus carnosus]QQS84579.1 MurR/RpiR family transcriptional regulator [Staphylococcus carnosus]UTB99861.1 RpiR family transcriptional regulator [Staphylococcus carnosus]UTC03348.1 RpiR family transcriptional regulator [Staphylococcus carnosus]